MIASNLHVFEEQIRTLATSGEYDKALKSISAFVGEVLSDQRSIASVFSSKILDRLCKEIGQCVAEDRSLSGQPVPTSGIQKQGKICLYIVTELAATGGHSRVLFDLMQADPSSRHVVFITDLSNNVNINPISEFLSLAGGVAVVAPRGTYLSKLIWLQRSIQELDPERIFMLLHHFDSVSVAAIQPNQIDRSIFIHNADHSLCLGVHLGCQHIDLHAKGYFNCKEILGVERNRYWPLTTEDHGENPDRKFLSAGFLTTCTSGGFEKFETPHLRVSIPYAYSYAELIPKILLATGGKHIHIGKLSSQMLATIKNGLRENWINPSRFVHVQFVKSIWRAMHELNIDLYVGSFPLGGGKGTLEVTGSGTPVVVHANYRSPFLCDDPEIYPEALRWSTPDELISVLRNADADSLVLQSKLARAHYVKHNHPSLLRRAIADLDKPDDEIAPPVRPRYNFDPLQTFLDWRSLDGISTQPAPIHDDSALLEEITRLKDEVHSILNSTSWRLSSPIRSAKRFIQRFSK